MTEIPIEFPKLNGKMYDTAGNEIEIPEGHAIVVGKDSCALVEVNGYTASFVYRPPANSKPFESKVRVYGFQ